jgi:acyl-CoA hydrolase
VSDVDIGEHLRPGDTVLIGQATAEPPLLVEKFIEAAQVIDDLTALCGYTLSDAWTKAGKGRPYIKSYAAHGALRDLVSKGLLDIVPWHYSRIGQLIAERLVPVDVVLLQVAPADADGYHNLGATVDYATVALETARVILVEVNENMPRTRSSYRLHRSRVTASVAATRVLAGSPSRPATDVEVKVAQNVASLIPSGATIQLGVGALADAVARALHDRRGLRVRSGLVGDWLVDLHEAGALDESPGSVVTGIALGGRRLYAFLQDAPFVEFAPISEQVAPAAMAACRPYVSVNSAIEVDLLGQGNSEVIGGRYVGAVGGQVDFFRAARCSEGGMAVVAMGSTSPSGTSRIVRSLAGPVTSLKSDVDLVVTEWGIADLRAASLSERAERLAAVADPPHRGELGAGCHGWIRAGPR